MFIYLSKKIAIPNGVKLKSLSWNGVNGWIVCGGENGLLKVLKLDSGRATDKAKGMAAPSNLSMNQTLEGHNGAVMCVCWNENYRKLTTSDQYGLIIVWMLHKGMWFEEMINNRNKSTVRGMKWTSDGQRICIIYEDGAVIVGSVDGNRLWGKELKTQLAHVEWSPDGRNIVFCTMACEVHIYDAIGNFISKMPLYCLEDAAAQTSLIGIDWYDGAEGLQDPNQPVLAIGLENGRLQLMRHEMDEAPVLIDTGMLTASIKWNTNGSVLAVAGNLLSGGSADRRDVSMVQFYAPHGQHLRTLKVPGSGISALSWEGGSLRVALAVDSYIYFANIRPDYRWGFFGDTLVVAYSQPERSDATVLFWNTSKDERSIKFVKKLTAIRASNENCVLATRFDDSAASNQHVLILCNDIGSPLDTKYIDFEPTFLCITAYHVIAASADFVYVWQYRTLMSKLTSVDSGTGSLRRREGRERCFHIDDVLSAATTEPMTAVRGREASRDSIIAIAASSTCLLVARESGSLVRYSLPHIALEHKYTLRYRAQAMAINCDSSRMSVIDVNGVLSLFDLSMTSSDPPEITVPAATAGEAPARFERKDVWDMRWADDQPGLFAVMEKTRMYIFNDLVAQEPVLSSAYLCSFSELEIRAVLLDHLMREPETPSKDFVLKFETKNLHDLRELLDTSLVDAFSYVEESPHPRLWKLIAEAALNKLDLTTAEKSFVKVADYMGIQFVKRLRLLDDTKKQAAEVATYFSNFDEAEKLYRDMDRRDLALQLRAGLGDWFKVVQLVQQGGGDDSLLQTAWNKIGDYFMERQKTAKAAQYYSQAKNIEALITCYYTLEDYAGLEKLIGVLPEGSPLLMEVGHRFTSVGMSSEAVSAYVKAGDVKTAIDSCVTQHQWEGAVQLAETHANSGIQKILSQYASHLLSAGKQLNAVELYRKANQYTDAARLLSKIGAEVGSSRMNPLRAKKLFVMAALEIERMRKKMLSSQAPEGGTQNAAQTLDSLVNQDQATGGDKWLDSAWRGAEAYHFLLLAQRQLYSGYPAEAMRTALRLKEYDGVLTPEEIYSLIALTAFYSKFYGQCSKAFVKLQALELPEIKKAEVNKLALAIFTRYAPADPTTRRADCPNCGSRCQDWDAHCGDCGSHFPACVISGKSLLEPHLTIMCRSCKHRFYEAEVRGLRNCALCHHPLPLQLQPSDALGMEAVSHKQQIMR